MANISISGAGAHVQADATDRIPVSKAGVKGYHSLELIRSWLQARSRGPADGSEGEEGPAGPPGRPGRQGLTGPTGPAGADGPLGRPGEDGEDGAIGPPGRRGPTGPVGSTGPAGARGRFGPTGPEGNEGPQGERLPGRRGATGNVGSTGPTGPRGLRGTPGPDGDDGDPIVIPGRRGTNGAAGSAGARGPRGYVGQPAEDAEDGPPGPPGRRGATGAQGPAGGGGGSATTVEVNLGSPKFAGKFTITDAGISATSKVLCWQAPGPYTGKGSRADEAELQSVQVIAVEPAAGSAVVKWQTPPCMGVSLETQVGRLHAVGATFDRLANQRYPTLFRLNRVGRVNKNVKFTYMVFT